MKPTESSALKERENVQDVREQQKEEIQHRREQQRDTDETIKRMGHEPQTANRLDAPDSKIRTSEGGDDGSSSALPSSAPQQQQQQQSGLSSGERTGNDNFGPGLNSGDKAIGGL